MRARILHIGVLDKQGRIHAVTFQDGVNVVTGRSSTGKSALIEIFDYCFGNSDFTVPVGVITECATIYFTVMHIGDTGLVLARRPTDSRAFLREEFDLDRIKHAESLELTYFAEDFFSNLDEFKKELKRHFNVLVTDVDEDVAVREWRRHRQKSPTPSVRSFTSYMLQHQNLVANKHAIFYRFDQKEKREQAIEHLKVFLGFADQQYFAKSQELNALERELRTLERSLPSRRATREDARRRLQDALREYEAISGEALNIDITSSSLRPKVLLNEIRGVKVQVFSDSDSHVRLKYESEDEKRKLVSKLRRKQHELAAVESSIEFSRKYAKQSADTVLPSRAELHASICPFCNSEHFAVEQQANELTEAINWLNSELSHSSYRLESFEMEKEKLEKELEVIRLEVRQKDEQIKVIEGQIDDLARVRSQYELAVEAKVRVENILYELASLEGRTDEELESLTAKIGELRRFLKLNYDIDSKLSSAESEISHYLDAYGARFDFEKSYTPIRLRFSLDTFDLWHEPKTGKPVYLRSMGSGANWLSCHLVLFLSLQRFFCEVGSDCSIPPILFFDQPSQVYFPSNIDGAPEFSAEELASKDSSRDKSRSVDEDVRAVTSLFEELVKYCKETAEATGTMPQIIVTDHADNLTLSGDVSFESLVRARWREEGDGLIDLADG